MGALSGIGMLGTKTKRAFRWGKPMGKKVKRKMQLLLQNLGKGGGNHPASHHEKGV
jgi:hypothetical protein